MRALRVYLLMLLVALIPLRGAMAHLQSCAGGYGALADQTAAKVGHALTHADSHHMGHADHEHHHPQTTLGATPDTDTAEPHGHKGKCSSCSSTCASACVVLPSVPGLRLMQAVSPKIPSQTTLSSQFLAEGPERPPRSLRPDSSGA